jgi:hypothetical protein
MQPKQLLLALASTMLLAAALTRTIFIGPPWRNLRPAATLPVESARVELDVTGVCHMIQGF